MREREREIFTKAKDIELTISQVVFFCFHHRNNLMIQLKKNIINITLKIEEQYLF